MQDEHPKGNEAKPNILLPERSSQLEAVMFEVITAERVFKTEKQVKGLCGPTLIDFGRWKQLLCSKYFGKTTMDL